MPPLQQALARLVDFTEYFIHMAQAVSAKSSCLRRQVGAVAVVDHRIVATGYNGTPSGLPNCNQGGCKRCAAPIALVPSGTALDLCLCVHAEANCVAHAAKHGAILWGAVLYTTHSPCMDCAKLLINSGVAGILFHHDYPASEEVRDMLSKGNVWCQAYGK
jgi:dCMP deaminase